MSKTFCKDTLTLEQRLLSPKGKERKCASCHQVTDRAFMAHSKDDCHILFFCCSKDCRETLISLASKADESVLRKAMLQTKNRGKRAKKRVISPDEICLHWGEVVALLVRQTSCCFCGIPLLMEDKTIEHLVPKSVGGSEEIENLAVACQPCNNKKGSRIVDPTPILTGH